MTDSIKKLCVLVYYLYHTIHVRVELTHVYIASYQLFTCVANFDLCGYNTTPLVFIGRPCVIEKSFLEP